MKKIRFSWMEVQEAMMNCLEQLKKENIEVEAVVSLGRGGSIPAGYIAYQLKKKMEYINYSRKNGYMGSTIDGFLKGTKFLLVDDATETGNSFETVRDIFKDYEFVTCVLFQSSKANYKPDVIGVKYPPLTPQLPWENKC